VHKKKREQKEQASVGALWSTHMAWTNCNGNSRFWNILSVLLDEYYISNKNNLKSRSWSKNEADTDPIYFKSRIAFRFLETWDHHQFKLNVGESGRLAVVAVAYNQLDVEACWKIKALWCADGAER